MLAEMRYALRAFRKAPGFALVAVLALAIGIGANTAIFSVVNAILLRSLPYHAPDRMVMIWSDCPKINVGFRELPNSGADFADFRKLDSFAHVTTFDRTDMNVTGQSEPYRVAGVMVAGDFFETFGVPPAMGRTFRAEEQQRGNHRVVMLSHALWTRSFGGARDILGSSIQINDVPHRIIGVMPPGFSYPRGAELPKAYGVAPATELWVPLAFTAEDLQRRNNRSYPVIARLKEVVSIAQANDALRTLAARVHIEAPRWSDWGFRAEPFRDSVVGRVETMVLVMSLAVAFVLLIACANVANLLLSRAAGRTREIAIRVALGAGRFRIIRQVLAESLLLSLVGGVLGVGLGAWGVRTLIALAPKDIPRLEETSVDATVLLFTLVTSILTALLFGFAPAWQLSRTEMNESLKEGARGSEGKARGRVRAVLTIAEVALAVVLLAGSGLLIRSFVQLNRVDPGFRGGGSVVTMDLVPPQSRYDKPGKVVALYQQLLAEVAARPRIEAAGGVSLVPLAGQESLDVFVTDRMTNPGEGGEPITDDRGVTHDYFRAMGIPLVAGRFFDGHETSESQQVVIVNETLATRFFPAGDAIGRRIKLGRFESKDPWREVIGIVKDVKQSALNTAPRPQVYEPLPQRLRRNLTLVVRSTGTPAEAVEAVRAALRDIDPQLPVGNIRTMEQVLTASVSRQRFTTVLLAIFAGAAILLAGIGLYGVLSYNVAQRTREIGVRVALGAGRMDIVRGVLGPAMAYVCSGLILGIAGSIALGRVMTSLLFEVSPTDPVTLAGVALFVGVLAAIAAWIPARRASRVDPLIALRWE